MSSLASISTRRARYNYAYRFDHINIHYIFLDIINRKDILIINYSLFRAAYPRTHIYISTLPNSSITHTHTRHTHTHDTLNATGGPPRYAQHSTQHAAHSFHFTAKHAQHSFGHTHTRHRHHTQHTHTCNTQHATHHNIPSNMQHATHSNTPHTTQHAAQHFQHHAQYNTTRALHTPLEGSRGIINSSTTIHRFTHVGLSDL